MTTVNAEALEARPKLENQLVLGAEREKFTWLALSR